MARQKDKQSGESRGTQSKMVLLNNDTMNHQESNWLVSDLAMLFEIHRQICVILKPKEIIMFLYIEVQPKNIK